MKYIVEVNAKWLVSIEAESLIQAEHKILDLDGIWGALAFDKAMMKTETFVGAVQFCEMISMDELKDYVDQYEVGWKNVAKLKDALTMAEHELNDAETRYMAAKAAYALAESELNEAMRHANNATDHIGRQRD